MTQDYDNVNNTSRPSTEEGAQNTLDFNFTKNERPSIIKVIGVGGGGGNAVKNMINEGIRGVSYLLCNTDRQAMESCNVAERIVLGATVTKGLGAGNRPEVARKAAESSADEIRAALDDGHTEMVFITAGMGGGTGTGAAPVIGRIARELGLLTVSIVTIPFVFEREKKMVQALRGVEEMRRNTDALLVINNERLRKIYQDLTLNEGFKKADETLTNAARGISDMIHVNLDRNVDFADVRTALKDGGVAIISIGYGEGKDRMKDAIDAALTSPLLNDNDITKAKNVYMVLWESSERPITLNELEAVSDLTGKIATNFDYKFGHGKDESLGQQVKVTILASGFDIATTRMSIDPNYTLDPVAAQVKQQELREDAQLIKKYYSPEDLDQSTSVLTAFTPVILSDEELDDEELIAAIAEEPAYSRTLSRINEIRARHGRNASFSFSSERMAQAAREVDWEQAEDLSSLFPEGSTPREEKEVDKPNIIRF